MHEDMLGLVYVALMLLGVLVVPALLVVALATGFKLHTVRVLLLAAGAVSVVGGLMELGMPMHSGTDRGIPLLVVLAGVASLVMGFCSKSQRKGPAQV